MSHHVPSEFPLILGMKATQMELICIELANFTNMIHLLWFHIYNIPYRCEKVQHLLKMQLPCRLLLLQLRRIHVGVVLAAVSNPTEETACSILREADALLMRSNREVAVGDEGGRDCDRGPRRELDKNAQLPENQVAAFGGVMIAHTGDEAHAPRIIHKIAVAEGLDLRAEVGCGGGEVRSGKVGFEAALFTDSLHSGPVQFIRLGKPGGMDCILKSSNGSQLR
jgi:hypothetical protein